MSMDSGLADPFVVFDLLTETLDDNGSEDHVHFVPDGLRIVDVALELVSSTHYLRQVR